MAKKPHPWFWEERNAWYVNVGGKRHRLGEHPTDAAKPTQSKKTGLWNTPPEIDAAFRKLFEPQAKPVEQNAEYVSTYLQAFVSWCKENRAPKTTARYFDFLDAFERRYHGLTVNRLTTAHVTDWLAEQTTWNSTTKFNAITALQRAFNWSVKNRGLARNPIHGMEKPQAKRRAGIVTPEEFEKLLPHCLPGFRDLLVVSYDSGARPFELKDLEARHVQMDLQRAVIPAEEAKGRKHTRVFYFPSERCVEVVNRLCAEHPAGPIFCNSRGRKWNDMSVKCAFARLDHVLGRRVTHYSLRHSFITRKIIAGVDSHVVATLSGHRSTDMIDKHYSAVAKDHEFLLEQARRDVAPKPEKKAVE